VKDKNHRTCDLCQTLTKHPMYMISPYTDSKSNPEIESEERILIAAQIKCTCVGDMKIDKDVNAADLNDLKPEIRQLIYNRIVSNKNNIPIIDPEKISNCDRVVFITDFSKKLFKNWMALDLLTTTQLREYIDLKAVTIEEVRI